MHPPHFSILREVFSYTARFLPSKDTIFPCSLNMLLSLLSFFQSIGLWRFYFLPFTLSQASSCFPEGFIYFSFMAVPLEHSFSFLSESIWLLKVSIFSFSFRMPCASMNYPPVHTGDFHGFYLFPSLCSQCHWHVYFSTILHAQDFLKVFISFPSFLQCCMITQHWGAECSIHTAYSPSGLISSDS